MARFLMLKYTEMNPFEEKLHALKVAYKADKAIAWEEYRAKVRS